MLLNKMLNHDHHKQIKPSSLEVIFLPPRRSLTPPSYLNRTLLDAFWIRKRVRLAVNKAGTHACEMYARTANMCSARVWPFASFSKVCVLRDWWPRPSPGKNYRCGRCRKRRRASPSLAATRGRRLIADLTHIAVRTYVWDTGAHQHTKCWLGRGSDQRFGYYYARHENRCKLLE